MSVSESTAIYDALAQVVSAMQTNFATYCATHELSSVPLPAPGVQDYYLMLEEPTPDQMVKNSRVSVFVYQTAPSELEPFTSLMSTPNVSHSEQRTFVGISVAYRMRPVEPSTLLGKTPSMSDIMAARGYRYLAAIIDTCRRHVCDGTVIAQVGSKESDAVGAIAYDEEDEPIVGVASVEWGLIQFVNIPACEG